MCSPNANELAYIVSVMALRGSHLKRIGFVQGKAIGVALEIAGTALKGVAVKEALKLFGKVIEDPSAYVDDVTFGPLALELLKQKSTGPFLRESSPDYPVYGRENIESGALAQMDVAMKLPIAVAGALMPDAHQGYGLPIGGVLATANAVIPYGVGVDIGCRMCMTIYNFPAEKLVSRRDQLKKLLIDSTRFGREAFEKPKDHPVLERKEFSELAVVRKLRDRAREQIGSSGGGNHFVEFGLLEVVNPVEEHGLLPGQYLALLSHSGSRALGANVARHYTEIAMKSCVLPPEAKHLAWLDLNAEEGQEYWLAMNLAGDYASACHHQIHERISNGLGEMPVAMIENHHNFAWKETDRDGNEIIVHRKGATPAAKGVLGIIPGSMATPGFLVRGKGMAESINSASHGAGRTMSRAQARRTILPGQMRKVLKQAGVDLIGSGLDEAPMAYKDIDQVMEYQKDLVEVLGSFMPKIVRMCGDDRFKEAD